jgi:hypothetical protein
MLELLCGVEVHVGWSYPASGGQVGRCFSEWHGIEVASVSGTDGLAM